MGKGKGKPGREKKKAGKQEMSKQQKAEARIEKRKSRV